MTEASQTVLFHAVGLDKRFGGLRALRDVDVVQRAGETLGMIGPNGSGKTSFVNSATGHFALDSGKVLLAGHDLTGRRPHEIARRGLVRTFQAVRVFARLPVRDNIETAALACDPAVKVDQREIVEWLRLDRLLDAPAGSLTLFEQRRLELAMRLVLAPKLIMLDEPAGGLAPTEIRAMIEVLQQLKSRAGLFVIEHTMRVIRELADRVVVLIAGEKIADGPPADILADRRVVEQYLGVAHA